MTVGIGVVDITKITRFSQVLRRPPGMGQHLFALGERSGQAVAKA